MHSCAHTRAASFRWLVLFCFCVAALGAHALQTLTLAWDPNSETNLAGYKLYYGFAPRTYPNVVNVGNVTTSSIPNLVEGTTYYIAVTAYNDLDVESYFSSEIAHTIPYPRAPISITTRGNGTVSPNLNGQWLDVGRTYSIIASPGIGCVFSNWSGTLSTTTRQLTFVMQSNMTLVATFIDTNRPTIVVTSPTNNAIVTNSSVIVQGTASDNTAVARVSYQINDGPYQLATGTAAWSAPVTLTTKSNIVRIKCVDTAGNESPVISRAITYTPKTPMRLTKRGKGKVTPDLSDRWLEVGASYTMTATADLGYTFSDWSGSMTSTNTRITFVMQSNLTFTVTFTDSAKPTLSIVSPLANARLTNGAVTLKGRAADNQGLAQVLCSLNDGPFQVATGTTNWAALLSLRAGRNVVRVKAVDLGGLESTVVSRVLTNVVKFPVAVSISGGGRVTPTNGQRLEIGRRYTATAWPGLGWKLTNWTGSILTNRTNFSFVMQSNLTLTANFVDVMKPTASITYPAANARLTNGTITLQGRASDNRALAQVFYGLNDGPWQVAIGTTNWSAPLDLPAGANKVRVKALDVTGFESTAHTQTVTYVVMFPLVVSINGNGSVTPNLDGKKLEIGKTYAMTALPSAGHLFSNWVGSISADTAALSFVMRSNLTFTAQFVTNPFIATKGTYSGLFYETNEVLHESSGFLKISVTDRGSFSASLVGGGVSLPFSGQFSLVGRATKNVARLGRTPLLLDLQLDLINGSEQVTGTVSDSTWIAEYLGDRSLWNATNNPLQGKYTVVLPGAPGDVNSPAGHGYGAVIVDRAGNLLLKGKSGDGQLLSQAVSVSRNGEWPLYAPLYTARGSMLSWLTFTNGNDEQLSGLLNWIRPAMTTAWYYRNGFTNETLVSGSRFTTGTNGLLNFANGMVVLSDGNLTAPITNYVTVSSKNLVTTTNSANFTMKLTGTNGVMSGTFRVPGTAVWRTFYGALLQSRDAGYGYFLGTNQSGQVRFEPAP